MLRKAILGVMVVAGLLTFSVGTASAYCGPRGCHGGYGWRGGYGYRGGYARRPYYAPPVAYRPVAPIAPYGYGYGYGAPGVGVVTPGFGFYVR